MPNPIPLRPTTLKAIIADTPFLSSKSSAAVISLPDRLEQLGLSTFEEMWIVSPEKLTEALSKVELQISDGDRVKSLPLAKVDPSAPGRLAKLLISTKDAAKELSLRGSDKISSKALHALLS